MRNLKSETLYLTAKLLLDHHVKYHKPFAKLVFFFLSFYILCIFLLSLMLCLTFPFYVIHVNVGKQCMSSVVQLYLQELYLVYMSRIHYVHKLPTQLFLCRFDWI